MFSVCLQEAVVVECCFFVTPDVVTVYGKRVLWQCVVFVKVVCGVRERQSEMQCRQETRRSRH